MKARSLVFALALAACNTGEDIEASLVVLDGFEVAPPPDWQMQDLGATTRVWTPDVNPRRESVTVIVGPRVLGGAEAAFAAARTAQGVLRDARVVGSTRFTSPTGITGLQMELKFRAHSTSSVTYARSHVVLFDEDRVVNVLYTAVDPDPERAALARVVGNLRRGDGS